MRNWLITRYLAWCEMLGDFVSYLAESYHDARVMEWESTRERHEFIVHCWVCAALMRWHDWVVQPFMRHVIRLTDDEIAERLCA